MLFRSAQQYRLAVASSSNQEVIDVVLEVAGLTQYFPTTVGGDAVQHHKPDPEVYFTTARKLGLLPDQCCAIEDSPAGIQAAKTAGLTVIGLTTGQTVAQLRHADHKFEWTLPEAQAWATATAVRFGKQVTLEPVGRVFQTYGSPTIGIVFT